MHVRVRDIATGCFVYKHAEESSRFWLSETLECWFFFSKTSTVLLSFVSFSSRGSQSTTIHIQASRTNKTPPFFSLLFMLLLSCSNRLYNPHVLAKKKKKKRFLLITVSNQRLDGKHCRRCHAQNKDNNTHPSL